MAVVAVDICNLALVALGQNRIASIDPPFPDDEGLEALCAFYYPLARDAELRKHIWNFSRRRAEIAEDGDEPLFGYDRQFRKPGDFVRLVPELVCKVRDRDWQVEGEFILTDDDAPLPLVYVARVDPSLFDPLFAKALGKSLALDLTEKITTSNTKKREIKDDYREAIAAARLVNAWESPNPDPPEDSFISVRY